MHSFVSVCILAAPSAGLHCRSSIHVPPVCSPRFLISPLLPFPFPHSSILTSTFTSYTCVSHMCDFTHLKPRVHKWEKRKRLSFWLWLILPNTMISSCIQVSANYVISSLLELNETMCVYIHNILELFLIDYLWISHHVSCSHSSQSSHVCFLFPMNFATPREKKVHFVLFICFLEHDQIPSGQSPKERWVFLCLHPCQKSPTEQSLAVAWAHAAACYCHGSVGWWSEGPACLCTWLQAEA